ncbi:MAG: hypothetical protein JWN52_8190 [Actinomycetia bacterium]|jgi:hypothetical protein|nr:hypothetical protein [Actinomycetes bacterium]
MADTVKEVGHFRGPGGHIIDFDLPLAEVYADQVVRSHLVRVNDDGTDYTGDAADPAQGAKPSKPSPRASQAAWAGWAVACGADREDAAAMTKQDLIEKYGKD